MFSDPDRAIRRWIGQNVMLIGGERKPGSIDPQVDESIAEMRQLLIEMRAIDTASALRSLRRAFPNAPLADRVRAIATVGP
jgi:hypothetical protein